MTYSNAKKRKFTSKVVILCPFIFGNGIKEFLGLRREKVVEKGRSETKKGIEGEKHMSGESGG
jgi:hypothetical protein